MKVRTGRWKPPYDSDSEESRLHCEIRNFMDYIDDYHQVDDGDDLTNNAKNNNNSTCEGDGNFSCIELNKNTIDCSFIDNETRAIIH